MVWQLVRVANFYQYFIMQIELTTYEASLIRQGLVIALNLTARTTAQTEWERKESQERYEALGNLIDKYDTIRTVYGAVPLTLSNS